MSDIDHDPSQSAVDYPAAHSMDTQWYAVDREGHVGFFESGEEGGVPVDAACEHESSSDPDFAILHAMRLARMLEAGRALEIEDRFRYSDPTQVVVVLDPPDGVDPTELLAYAPELAGDFMQVIRAEPPVVLLSRIELDGQYIEDVRDLPAVRGAWSIARIDGFLHDHAGADGIFHFEAANPWGSLEPYRYERRHAPQRGINVAELPAAVQEKLAALRLQLDFEGAKDVKLDDHILEKKIGTWS
ncbi:MAG: hypothetical protein AAF799_15265 [Myxococcota bacterium]